MKQRFLLGVKIFSILFMIFFFFRLIYSYIISTEGNIQIENSNSITNDFEIGRKNYASEKMVQNNSPAQAIQNATKYEKVGVLGSKSDEFDKHESDLKASIKKWSAIIQHENRSGLTGKRVLNLGIGVSPENFDSMIDEIQKIGTLDSIQVNKTDKTSEFSDLNAKKASLLKARDSLLALKNRNLGKLDELINLEDKILQVEESIQKLGVQLGQFNLENEFCTIKFSLKEKGLKEKSNFFITFLKKVKISLEWTIKYFLLTCALFGFFAFSFYISFLILDKLKFFYKMFNKDNES